MGFQEFAFSLQMRDTIDKMIRSGIDKMRPKYRYATVDTIDRVNYKCTVTFNGEANPVEVSMGALQPSAVGQVVRVEGIGIDKFITDVIGESYTHTYLDGRIDTLTSNTNLEFAARIAIRKAASLTEAKNLATTISVSPTNPLLVERTDLPPDQRLQRTTDGKFFQQVRSVPQEYEWNYAALLNSWTNYDEARWSWARYTKTSVGIVVLEGLIKGGSAAQCFTLPVGYRPDARSMFYILRNADVVGRMDIETDGRVILSLNNTGWTQFKAMFPAADPSRIWSPMTLGSGWAHYLGSLSDWPFPSTWKDSLGRVWSRGMAYRSTPSVDLGILTAGHVPAKSQHFPALANDAHGSAKVDSTTGQFQWLSGGTSTYFNLCGIMWDTSDSHWTTIPQQDMLNSWQLYNTSSLIPCHKMYDDGIVAFAGLIKSGTLPNRFISPLPGRDPNPVLSEMFSCCSNTGGTTLSRIDYEGNVTARGLYNRVGSNTWIDLSGIRYLAQG